ncbi:MAG: NUDIX domain-containing protein [Pseudomonadota bacterium]
MRVNVLEKDTVFQGFFRVERYQLKHSKFDGSVSEPLSREIFERGHAVGALAYDPDRDTVVLIKQFRVGAFAAGADDPWLIEVVAGMINTGEAAEAVARRELLEETGLTAGRAKHLCSYYVSPGGATEHVELYCLEVDSSQAQAISGHAAEGEDIQTLVMPVDQALQLMRDNKINNAVSLIAVQWLAMHHAALRQEWQEL